MPDSALRRDGTPRDTPSRRWVPPLGRTSWSILGLNAASCFGSGLTKPFLIVYLHDARGVGLATGGLLLSAVAVAGVVTMPVAGVVIDRIGPFRTFALGQVVGGIGTAAFLAVRSPVTALVACALVGVSGGITTNGLSTLLAVVVPADRLGTAFGLAYTSHNLGIGAGAATAGLVIATGSVLSYPVVFLADAVSYLVLAAALLVFGRTAPDPGRRPASAGFGYRAVLADRALLVTACLSALVTTAALSQTSAAIPALATGRMGLSTTVVGIAFAGNAVVLACCQLLVIRLGCGRRRTTMAACAGLVFAAAWLILFVTPFPLLSLVAATAVFGVGEALLAPTLPAVVNDIASHDVRGRYNAVFNMSGQVGMIAGPALTGWLLGAGRDGALLGVLTCSCLLCAAAAVPAARLVPDRANRVGTTTPGS